MKIRSAKTVLPVVVSLVGLLAATGLVWTRPTAEPGHQERKIQRVRVVIARPEAVTFRVESQGTVSPRTESELVAETSGRIVWVSPALEAGSFFDEHEVLARIDPVDQEIALEAAAAMLARRESEFELARANLGRRRSLAKSGAASVAALDDAENAERVATAAVREAAAHRTQAERNLARTEVAAPFAGRVRETHVDLGQFVNRGVSLARIYAIDYAEVRLPIRNEELAFLDSPAHFDTAAASVREPDVLLTGRFAGREHTWRGHLARIEGDIDPRTRMTHAVVRVEDPYRRRGGNGPPLAAGLFVRAEIEGRTVESLVRLPRKALRGSDEVVVVDSEERLVVRRVEVARTDRESVYLLSGLNEGERVCAPPPAVVVEGQPVRVVEDAP